MQPQTTALQPPENARPLTPSVPYGLLDSDPHRVVAALDACRRRAAAQQHGLRAFLARRPALAEGEARNVIWCAQTRRYQAGSQPWSPAEREAGAAPAGWAMDIGQRFFQEDRCACAWFGDRVGVAAVFDGHGRDGGGANVAERLADHVARALHGPLAAAARAASVTPAALSRAEVTRALLAGVEVLQRLTASDADGAVGAMAVVDGARLWAVNLGDARIVWLPAGAAPQRLTFDQRAHERHERQLIGRLQGYVYRRRLGGWLAVSRSFGDVDVDLKGVVRVPDITCVPMGAGGRLVLASDGVCDAVDERVTAQLADAARSPRALAEALVYTADARGSGDNKAALVLDLPAVDVS